MTTDIKSKKLSDVLPKAPLEDRIHLEQGTKLCIIWAAITPGKAGKRVIKINSRVDGELYKYYYTGNVIADTIGKLLIAEKSTDGTFTSPIICKTVARKNPAGQEYLELVDDDEE